ncbi:MAG: outer membrane beta-barrel protein [Bacteroidia bacterium]
MGNYYSKRLLIALFFLFEFANCFSQRFNSGIVAGLTATQVSGDDLQGFDKPGLQVGALVSAEMSQKFDLSFQILYTQKGSKRKSNVEQGDFQYYLLKLNYIEVPLLFTYKSSKKVHIESGISYGYLASSSEEDETGVISDIPDRKKFKNYELGFLIGMNYMLFENFYLNLQATNSILPVREYEPGTYKIHRDQYNSGLLFTFKYIFKKTTAEQ